MSGLNILTTTQAATGHLRPLIPVAAAAAARGHRVTVLAPDRIAGQVKDFGLVHRAGGYDWAGEASGMLPENYPQLRFGAAADVLAAADTPMMDAYTRHVALGTARDILVAADELRPDLILREACEFGGYLAAEVLGIPQVAVASFGGPATIAGPAVAARLDVGRTALGLPPDPRGDRLYAYRYASFVPECYGEQDRMLPNTRSYRHPVVEQPGARLPSWLIGVDHERPFVFAAFGTVVYDLPGAVIFLRRLVAALGALPATVVVSVGSRFLTTDFPDVPENVRLVNFVEQPLLLEGCELFITHGGLNSVKDALRFGVPMVSVPVLHDQRHNARCCAELGISRTVAADAVTEENLRAACAEVLSDPGYRSRARAVQREMHALPEVGALLDDMESIAHTEKTGVQI